MFGAGIPLPAGNEQPYPSSELSSDGTGPCHSDRAAFRTPVFFFPSNLLTVFSAQKPFGAYCPTEEVTQSIIHNTGFANCHLVQSVILAKTLVGRGGE